MKTVELLEDGVASNLTKPSSISDSKVASEEPVLIVAYSVPYGEVPS